MQRDPSRPGKGRRRAAGERGVGAGAQFGQTSGAD